MNFNQRANNVGVLEKFTVYEDLELFHFFLEKNCDFNLMSYCTRDIEGKKVLSKRRIAQYLIYRYEINNINIKSTIIRSI